MAKPALTDAIQDYLREIYKLGADGGRVSVTALAKRQGVSPASASAMVKKLAALELAVHQPYRGIELTTAGEQVALEVIRHHRLLELYLAETLGVDVEAVHDEAERLEHALSEELEERIDKALGPPPHRPDPAPLALDPDHDRFRSARIVDPMDDLFGEAALRRFPPHGAKDTIARCSDSQACCARRSRFSSPARAPRSAWLPTSSANTGVAAGSPRSWRT